MSNTILTPDMVVTDSALMLRDELLVANLSNRNYQGQFNGKVGDTVTINVPSAVAASELASGGSTSAADITETGVDVIIEKHFYTRVDLTAKQLAMEIDEFNARVAGPVISGLKNKVEEYAYDKLVGGFVRSTDSGTSLNISGTAGNEPSTLAHIVAARKVLKENKADMSQLVGIITPTAEASFLQLNAFTNADYGADRPNALREGSLGRLYGTDWFCSPDASSAFDYGDEPGTVLVDGTASAGASYIHVDGFTAADGVIKEGTTFTVAGTATIYTVTKDATIATNEADLYVYPALSAEEADGDALTFQTAPTQNVIYNPRAFAGAIVAPPAASANSAMGSADGVQVRIIADTSTSSLATTWVWDVFCGFKAVKQQHGVLLQG